jgi:hypothetical protein
MAAILDGGHSEIPLPSDDFLFDLLELWDVRALSIRKTELGYHNTGFNINGCPIARGK